MHRHTMPQVIFAVVILLILISTGVWWYASQPIIADEHWPVGKKPDSSKEGASQENKATRANSAILAFSDDPNSPGYTIAASYFKKDLEEAAKVAQENNSVAPSVLVAKANLFENGWPVVIARLVGPTVCDLQCPTAVLVRADFDWRNVVENLSAQSVAISSTTTHGAHDLIFNIDYPIGSPGSIWKWNGSTYEYVTSGR